MVEKTDIDGVPHVNTFLRRIGKRVCATFDCGNFYMSECEETDEDFLRQAVDRQTGKVGIEEKDMPCYRLLPARYREVVYVVSGS